jgi:signal transduction histidine kinase
MQTRARGVGGEVDISSMPGEGTTVLVWVPRM